MEASRRWGDWKGRVNLVFDPTKFTENGVVGDPREASAVWTRKFSTSRAKR